MSTVQTLEVPGYQVMRFLGTGARSTIWQIRDRRTDQLLALKRVLKRRPSDARFLEQAVNEHGVAQHLDHPNIRRILDIRRIKRWLSLREVLLIMEYCEGRSVQDARPQTVAGALDVFLPVAEALVHMHAKGFIHADMKPNNIMVAPDGMVKIIDLGQSCPLGTVKRRIQGTPDFIAPEQVYRHPLDARTDVFNFGAALYWTLTGQPIPTVLPKKGSTSLKADLIVKPADQLNAEVPSTLSKLLADCVELRPTRRVDSMSDVRSRLGLIAHTVRKRQQNGDGQTGETQAPSANDQ